EISEILKSEELDLMTSVFFCMPARFLFPLNHLQILTLYLNLSNARYALSLFLTVLLSILRFYSHLDEQQTYQFFQKKEPHSTLHYQTQRLHYSSEFQNEALLSLLPYI